MCYSAWQLIASLLWLLEFVLVSNICSCIFWPLMCPFCRRMFGFVARRTGSATENVCHLFAEMDPEQPAVAIVNFINKVMLGPQLHRWESRTKLWTAGDLREMLIWFWHVFFCFLWSVCVSVDTFACICTGGTTVLGCTTVFITEPGSGRSELFRAKCCLCVSLQSKQFEGKSSISQRLT